MGAEEGVHAGGDGLEEGGRVAEGELAREPGVDF